jgi:hypothetical protein
MDKYTKYRVTSLAGVVTTQTFRVDLLYPRMGGVARISRAHLMASTVAGLVVTALIALFGGLLITATH